MSNTPKVTTVEQLAERYADELSAQFRTLNLFVQHAGEIGRSHETFVRDVLRRFLPRRMRIGTGFVVGPGGTTSQQDIIIFDEHCLPLLFEVGECLVVDSNAVAATIEVKTRFHSCKDILSILTKLHAHSETPGAHWSVGLCVLEGPSLDLMLKSIWEYYRSQSDLSQRCLPDFIYVRGSYFIIPNYDGRLDSAPFLLMKLGNDSTFTEGAALLSIVESLWISRIQLYAPWPWWLTEWRNHMRTRYKHELWPKDLADRVQAHLTKVTD